MLLGGSRQPQDIDPSGDPRDNIVKLNDNLRVIFELVENLSNPEQSPTLRGANLLSLDRSRMVATNRKSKLTSVRELSNWINGKSGIVVKDNKNGGVDISISSSFSSFSGESGSILGDIDYDEVVLTFTGGFMTQLTYNLAGVLVETVNITWNAYGQPVTATSVFNAKTATITYLGTGFPERITIT